MSIQIDHLDESYYDGPGERPTLFVWRYSNETGLEEGRMVLTEKDAEDLMKKLQSILGSRHENIP